MEIMEAQSFPCNSYELVGLSPVNRHHQTNIYFEVRDQLDQFIKIQAHPIIVYRWLICYVMNLPEKNLNDFVMVKRNDVCGSKINGIIVERMRRLGVNINYQDQFSYVICKNQNTKSIAHRAYEIEYFRQSNSPEPKDDCLYSSPLEIDYAYYVKGLSVLEKMLQMIEPLHSEFYKVTYRRRTRCRNLNLGDNPIKMMHSMILAKIDLSELLREYDVIACEVLAEEFIDKHKDDTESFLDSLFNP